MCRSVIAWPIARAGNGYPPRCLSILEMRGPAGRSLKQMSGWGRLRRSGPGDLAPRVGFRRFGSAEPTSETRELEAVASDRNRQHNRWNRALPLRRRAAPAGAPAGERRRIPPRRGGAGRHWCARPCRTSGSAASGPGRPRTARPTSRRRARCPAIHCRRTSSASWPCTEAVSASACHKTRRAWLSVARISRETHTDDSRSLSS